MRFPQNQKNELREHFRNHIYYQLCRQTHDTFQQYCPTIILSTEELFADAAKTLDILLTEGDFEADRCMNLWSDTLADYREKDGINADATTTQAEVAMLFYAVMFGLQSVNHSHYRGKLQRALHLSIHQMWNKQGQKNCDAIEEKMPQAVDSLTNDMLDWMQNYFTSTENLTDEIDNVMYPNKVEICNGGLPLPSGLDTQMAQTYFERAIAKGWMKLENNNKFIWLGIGKSAHSSQLAYFCGRVYGYKHSVNGNCGAEFPEAELFELFGVKRLYILLTQAHNAKKKQTWRPCIDELFEL